LSVTDVDAERVFRCAFRLQQVAEDVRTAADRTARCYPDDWRGDAGIAYQMRLDETAARVRRMSVAYDAAAAVVLPYARALLEAQDMWRRSESLLAEAEAAEQQAAAAAAAAGVARLDGPGPAEGFRSAAYRLQADAADVERRAAVVCAANLDDEAGRAPAPGTWRKVDRFLGDTAGLLVDTVAGTASLAGMAWHALPGVGSRHSRHKARDDLVEAGKGAVLSIWNLPVDMRHDLADGRPGLALSAALSVVGPGKLSKLGKESTRHLVHDVRLAHLEAFREADLRVELAGHVKWRQSADDMGRKGVDLRNEEARGGHVRLRHVAAEDEYLFARNDSGVDLAGTFEDLASAQRLVNKVLTDNAHRLAEVYRSGRLTLIGKFDEPTGHVAVRGEGRTVTAYYVRVVLRLEGGEPLVYTAFPELETRG
jgi:hypothetical protein